MDFLDSVNFVWATPFKDEVTPAQTGGTKFFEILSQYLFKYFWTPARGSVQVNHILIIDKRTFGFCRWFWGIKGSKMTFGGISVFLS